MNYHELTPGQKERFRRHSTCPLCGKEILYEDACAYADFKYNKRKAMVFFHAACLSSAMRGGNDAEKQNIKGRGSTHQD